MKGGVDEQLIMSQTSHSSWEGVTVYKQTTTKLIEVAWDVLNGEYHNEIKREVSACGSNIAINFGTMPQSKWKQSNNCINNTAWLYDL